MSDIKWIKITTDIFDDEKILLIESLPESYAIIVVWFKLLCLAGKMNNSGVFVLGDKIAYTDKMLSTIFRMKETTVTLALQTFEQFGMIEIVDGVITIPNWGKHQSVDRIEAKNDYQKNYMRKYREKQKLLCKTNSKANSKTNSKANVSSIEEDKKEIKNENKRVIPSLEEIKDYISEKGLSVDPNQFFNYYTAGDWHDKDGNPVKSWKQKLISWNGRKAKPKGSFEQRTDDIDSAVLDRLKERFKDE